MARGIAQAPFLVDHPGGRVWTYRDLRGRDAIIAGALQERAVKPGDRVAGWIAKSAEGLMLFRGVVAASAAFLPLNPASTMAELAFFLGDAEPALVVESAVISAPHRDLGDGVVAAVVPAVGAAWDEAAPRGRLERRLARYKLPKQLVAVAELLRNNVGKVQNSLLRKRFRHIFDEAP